MIKFSQFLHHFTQNIQIWKAQPPNMGLPGFLGALTGSTEASRLKKPHALVIRMSLQAKPLGLGPNQSLFSGGDMVILRHVVQVTVLDKLN